MSSLNVVILASGTSTTIVHHNLFCLIVLLKRCLVEDPHVAE
jgi:hypothetical protein